MASEIELTDTEIDELVAAGEFFEKTKQIVFGQLSPNFSYLT